MYIGVRVCVCVCVIVFGCVYVFLNRLNTIGDVSNVFKLYHSFSDDCFTYT